MGFTEIVLLATGAFVAVVFAVVGWTTGMVHRTLFGAGWARAVAAVSKRFSLHHTPVVGHWDMATGSVAGVDVTLEVGSWSEDSLLSGVAMKLETGGGFSNTLTITRRGEAARVFVPAQPQGWDYPTPIGAQEIDGPLSVSGAEPGLVQGLQSQAELRQLLLHVVGSMGAQVCAGELTFRRRSIATDESEIVELLGPLLDLAKWLSEPAGPHPQLSRQLAEGGHAIAASVDHVVQGPERQQNMWQLVQAIGAQVGPGQVSYDEAERATDWTGPVYGCPTRIRVELSSDAMTTLSLGNRAARFSLEYDTHAIPQVGTPPPWDVADDVKVFVARGVYFIRSGEAEMASFRELPAAVQEAITATIQRDNIRWTYLEPTHIQFRYRHDVNDMADPVGDISRGAQLLGWVAQHLLALPPSTALRSPPGQSLVIRVSCRYCSTTFLHGQRHDCPNCGAPYQG